MGVKVACVPDTQGALFSTVLSPKLHLAANGLEWESRQNPFILSALAPLRRIMATLIRSRYQNMMAIGDWEWQISTARLQDPRRRASQWDLWQRFRAAGCSPSGDGVMPQLSQMQVYTSGFLWHFNSPGERTWCAQPLSLAWSGNDVPFGQVWKSVLG
jgi:hypothetical protein